MFAALATTLCLAAQNPFVQTWYTSDPAPMVHNGTLYVYTGHDEDRADFFWMQEWRVYSTQDMVNWQDHGSPLALESFSWADDRAWASQCIERNGKFYWYICAHSRLSNGMATQVYYAKLNDDMISIDGEVQKLDMTEEAFGGPITTSSDRTTT